MIKSIFKTNVDYCNYCSFLISILERKIDNMIGDEDNV